MYNTHILKFHQSNCETVDLFISQGAITDNNEAVIMLISGPATRARFGLMIS